MVFHRALIAAFGGSAGVRNAALLESALDRARNEHAYGSKDLFELASAYAHGIAKNHPFVDGNERMAFTVARVFLGIHGVSFDPPDAEAVLLIEGLASGSVSRVEFAEWLRTNSKRKRRRRL